MCKKISADEMVAQNERLKTLLLNAIALAEEGIVDTQAEPFEYENTIEWLEDKIGITKEELEELGYCLPEEEVEDE